LTPLSAAPATPSPEPDLKPCHALLLEDSAVDADLAIQYLSQTRYPIVWSVAACREEFVAALAEKRYDVILSDYSLPDFDGLSALEMVRRRDADLPFIFISGVVGEEFAVETLRKGATDYVLKQRLSRLPGVIDRALAEAEERRERRRAETALQTLNETLERRVEARTQELAAVNRQLIAQIEERERVEATLRQMQRLEAVGQLTSGIAHDFNNLLMVVLGNIDLVLRTVDDPKLRRRLEATRLAAERGAALTRQLLAFSRRQRLEPRSTDLARTLSGMMDLLQSSLGGAITVETRVDEGLWPALVDRTQIELVILNLAINARDAMEGRGGLTFELANISVTEPPARAEEPLPGDYVAIHISDTGPGIPSELLAKVFEPFFTTKEVGKGSGLGLSQVLGFVQQSGGGVRIDSRSGQGATVIVFIPRAASAPVEDENALPGQEQLPAAPTFSVLVVDDDTAVRDITVESLALHGFEATGVASGREALAHAENHAFDVAVVDVAMPDMNGVELADALNARRPGLPVLFVTGFADLKIMRGVDENRIVLKPVLSERLAAKIRNMLRREPG
jgi:signal transduction histidine kinase